MRMSLTKSDLSAIKKLFDASFDERVPAIIDRRVQPMLDKLEERLTHKIDELALNTGQFSLETTQNFNLLGERIDTLDTKLSEKIDDLSDKWDETTDMADTNRVEVAKIKRKLGLT
jgi:hypothetical protein